MSPPQRHCKPGKNVTKQCKMWHNINMYRNFQSLGNSPRLKTYLCKVTISPSSNEQRKSLPDDTPSSPSTSPSTPSSPLPDDTINSDWAFGCGVVLAQLGWDSLNDYVKSLGGHQLVKCSLKMFLAIWCLGFIFLPGFPSYSRHRSWQRPQVLHRWEHTSIHPGWYQSETNIWIFEYDF